MPDVSAVFCLMEPLVCPFPLCFHEGSFECPRGFLPFDSIACVAGYDVSTCTVICPPHGSPWVRGTFRFQGCFARRLNGIFEGFQVFMSRSRCSWAMTPRQVTDGSVGTVL
jgi:hypothetical protein